MATSQTTGTLTAINDTVVSNLTGGGSCLIDVEGTYTGLTVVIEGTLNGSTWSGVVAYRANTNAPETGSYVLGATNRAWIVPVALLTAVRVRCTAISTLSATVTIHSGDAIKLPIVPANLVQYKASNVGKTTTAVAAGSGNANVVATASGPGILHKIIVTTAGSASLVIFDNATTNAGQKMYASPAVYPIGTVTDINMVFANGLTARQASGTAAVTLVYTLI